MGFLTSLLLILMLLGQAVPLFVGADDVFSPKEKAKLLRETSIDGRTKVYREASIRIQKGLHQSISKKEIAGVPDTLKIWNTLLAKSLEDIESNLKAKKKPRSLINYEIQVRKAIVDIQNYKITAPVDQQNAYDACLADAERVRKRFVEILFALKS